ncbi:MAG: methionine adenosyltransferase [Bacteroidales bacterium]|nr:methionine adenosyltransferase [Bacteroidales bacterium]
MNNYLFTSESVSEGHPDKVADQISDSILDEFLRQDPEARVAVETFCTAGLVIVGGEVASQHAYVDIPAVVRATISRIGYTKAEYGFDAASCGVISTIHEQSGDIARGVVRAAAEDQGAGDQGMMFGFACKDTPEYMPLSLYLSHSVLQILADIRHSGSAMPYLRPDSKAQFTIEFSSDTHMPVRVHTMVLSTQHDPFDPSDEVMHERIEKDVRTIVLPRLIESLPADLQALFDDKLILYVNPTGKFVEGGPAADTGLTGRKIIVDTYGGRGAHGGGAFSGKDPSKVDRSAAYAARWLAKNLVAAGVADECLVQLSYAIGVAKPLSIFVDTYGTAHVGNASRVAGSVRAVSETDAQIATKLGELFDLTPAAIIRRFGLKNPIYAPTAAYGHFGKKPYVENGIQFFGWEKLDAVPEIQKAFLCPASSR